MLTLMLFLVFALGCAYLRVELDRYAPLLRLASAPACPSCGRRGWAT